MRMKLSVAAAVALLAVGSTQSPAVVVELIQNGGLENWTAGNPDNWSVVQTDASGAVQPTPVAHAQETTDLRPGTSGTSAFKLDRAASDFTYRYFLHSNDIPLLAVGTTASYSGWQKGPNCRSYIEQSDDSGATWAVHNTTPLGGVTAPTSWTNVTAPSITDMADGDTGNTATSIHRLVFHSFSGVSLVDDVSIMGDDGTAPPLSISSTSPDNDLWLSGTVTITANPAGGSGVYNQVQFDVNGDSTIEHTDTTAPFEYTWNTASTVAVGPTAVNLKMIVTDNTSATGETTFSFTLENRNGGRQELMTNGAMSNWTAGLPNDWISNQPGAAVVTEETAEGGLAAPSLKINFPAFDNANRATLRHIGKQNTPGIWENHQVTYWGKGANSALGYWKSTDGVTWETAGLVAAVTGSTNWTFGIGSVQATVAPNANEWSTVTTLNLEGDAWYDDISWKATSNTPLAVEDWYQY